ncbi:MAG: phage tail protein [Clostridiales Family XIII bacterium]|jgi:hypothetical protein|nr:phage tail protein [Clostridiales Family XIII bacterium]
MASKQNVTVAKPKIAGAIYAAPEGTTLPADATTALTADFVGFGYISEDGLTNAKSVTSIKAWGGDTVLMSSEETFKFTLIEALNPDVLKFAYGEGNVSDADGALTILHRDVDMPTRVIVCDMLMTNGRKKRIVVPSASVSEVGEVKYTATTAVGYETTVSAAGDGNGVSVYEHISAPAVSA